MKIEVKRLLRTINNSYMPNLRNDYKHLEQHQTNYEAAIEDNPYIYNNNRLVGLIANNQTSMPRISHSHHARRVNHNGEQSIIILRRCENQDT